MTASPSSVLALSLAVASQGAPDGGDLRAGFGFSGFEIYELDTGIAHLVTGDFDGDGRADLAVANDARSRVEVLVRLDEAQADAPDPDYDPTEPNAIRFDGRFRRTPVAVERRVQELATADLDGDGRSELVFASQGGRLTVVFDPAGADPRRELERRYDELADGVGALRAFDSDGDGKDELFVAGPSDLLWLTVDRDEGFGPVRILDHPEDPVADLALLDLDGDGRRDLVTIHVGGERPFRVRRQEADGSFGPRVDAVLPAVRSAIAADVLGDAAAELVAVSQTSGRVTVYTCGASAPDEASLVHYALQRAGSERSQLTFTVDDLDGDGLDDVVAADAAAASVQVFRGGGGGASLTGTEHASLVGVAHPRIGDVDGVPGAELVCVSGPERMIGVTRLDAEGHMPFPTTRGLAGEPSALDLCDWDGDGRADAVVALTVGEGRDRESRLAVYLGTPEGLADAPALEQPLADARKVPSALLARDLSRDGRPDVVVFYPGTSDAPQVLLQEDGGLVADRRGRDVPGLGILEGGTPARLEHADLDGDGAGELVVGAGALVRAMVLEPDGKDTLAPRVLRQLAAPSRGTRIDALAVGDVLGPDAEPEVVLYDGNARELLVTRVDPTSDRLVLVQRVPSPRAGAGGLLAGDLDGDGRTDLVALGERGFGVLSTGARAAVLTERASLEPSKVGLHFDRLAAGDLNADGRLDVAVTELTESALVLLAGADDGLVRALGFRVFERQPFGASGEAREPHEIVAADWNGDGKDDLALLVHDKLVLYLQE